MRSSKYYNRKFQTFALMNAHNSYKILVVKAGSPLCKIFVKLLKSFNIS